MEQYSTVVVRIEPGQDGSPTRRDTLAAELTRDLEELSQVRVSVPEGTAPARTKALSAPEIGTLIVSVAWSAAAMNAFAKVLVKWIGRCDVRSVDIDAEGISLKGYSRRDAAALLDAFSKIDRSGTPAKGAEAPQALPESRRRR